MKDITDYFLSPTKNRRSSEQMNKTISAQCPPQNLNIENKNEDDPKNFKLSKDELPKQTKKKKRRKPTDPEVKNVTELLSNNLSLISPNTNGTQQLNSPSIEKKSKKVKHDSLDTNMQNAIKESNKSDENYSKDNDNGVENVRNKFHVNSKPDKAFKNKSQCNTKEDIKYEKDIKELKAIIDVKEIIETEPNSETLQHTPKVNAFQFLMTSRSNVIGQNSEGKTISEPDNRVGDQKTKLSTRKDLFKNWADQKGALKRKREDEEIDRCINGKMEKRKKRFKKLLKVKTEEKEKILTKHKLSLKSKKSTKILRSSDSENSNDLPKTESGKEVKSSNSLLIDISQVIEENAQDTILTISSPPSKKQNKESQNNLLNFFGVLSKEPKEEKIEVFEEPLKQSSKPLIKIKMFTPESTKKRTSLFSLNREQAKSVTDESSQESVKVKRHKKNKKKHHHTHKKCYAESELNNSLEDFCSSEVEQVDKSVHSTTKKKQLKKNVRGNATLEDKDKIDSSKEEKCSLAEKKEEEMRVDEFVKEWDSENELKVHKTPEVSINMEHILINETTKNSDIVQPKKRFNTEHPLLADDTDDSRSSAVEKNSRPELSIMKPVVKTKSKLCIDEESKDNNISVDNLRLREKSLKDSRVNTLESQRKAKTHIIDNDSDDSLHNTNAIARKTKKNLKTRVSENNSKDLQMPDNAEPQGRVLRPKRSNVNYTFSLEEKPKSLKIKRKTNSSVKVSKKSLNQNESAEKIELSSESEYEERPEKQGPTKVAPVFLQATPKPKLDPEIIEARKKFLMSGVPDSLKKTVKQQKSMEERDYDVFPSVSHIQQKCQSSFWNLPKPNLKYSPITHLNLNEHTLTVHDLIVRNTPYEINMTTKIGTVKHIKRLLDEIKADNPSYPVYKVFRHIYEKSGKNFLKESKSAKRRTKKIARKSDSELPEVTNLDSAVKGCEMWSEKYKPRSSKEILGNHAAVSKLKNWLEIWMNYSDQINSRGKRKTNSNSESEFESTDCDSGDSTGLPGNTMILGGPCGSGKSSAVYAIANELAFNVLELNASSKRTGKKLLQEFQEATQSHQVRKDSIALTNYIKLNKIPHKTRKEKEPKFKDREADQAERAVQRKKTKMCILLIEDVDLVFDQDDGFLTSLSQLITTSKRPIILTTTDSSPGHVQKLIVQHDYISFMPLSLQCLGVWLQLLCLVEGLLVDKDDLGNLLEYNKGDIRKTLLEVQFWSQSGGQLERSRVFPLTNQHSKISAGSDLKESDEELKINLTDADGNELCFVHKHCIGTFEVLRENMEYVVPLRLNLGVLWWNIPSILSVSNCAEERLHRQKARRSTNEPLQTNDNDISEELSSVLCLYDALTISDALFKTVHYHTSNEPVFKNWMTDVRASAELTEREDDRDVCSGMVHDLTHTLVNGYVESYRAIVGTTSSGLINMALPDSEERRWRAKQHICEDFLKEPIPLWNSLDRSSIAVDYLPTLREIARYEAKRAASNTKRGNRFRHYLKNLNMEFKESSSKLACNVLNLSDND